MPTDACQFFYDCSNCKTVLRPKEGDCCVFCSYTDTICPVKQLEQEDNGCANSSTSLEEFACRAMFETEQEPTIDSRLAFQGRLVNVRIDTIKLPGDRTSEREIVEHAQCVCVVPLDGDGNVVMVRQYRKPVEKSLLEVPAGSVDEGETPEEAVVRELQEETGYTADRIEHLSSFWTCPGFCTELMHAYVATNLSPGTMHPDEDEIIQVIKVPQEKVLAMVRSGDIRDAKSIASLMLLLSSTK